MTSTDVIASKGDLDIYVATFVRSRKGINLHVQCHPSIEDLFRDLAPEPPERITRYGRAWESAQELYVHQLPETLVPTQTFPGGVYCIDRPGQHLFEHRGVVVNGVGYTGEVLNMSFLRVVGISSGINLSIPGVFTSQSVRQAAERSQLAAKQLYLDFIRPVGVTVRVVTQDWKGI